MGNLNCCTNQQAPLDIGTTDNQTFQQNADITNPEKQQFQAGNIEEPQQEQEQLQSEKKAEEQVVQQPVSNYAESRNAQRTEYPEASFTDGLKDRVSTYSPLLVNSLKELEQTLPFLTLISEPSEQVIQLKQYLLGLQNTLTNLLNNWIAVYEAKRETTNYVQSLNDKLAQIRVFLSSLEKKAQEAQKQEGQTIESLLRDYLREQQNTEQIVKEFVEPLQNYTASFKLFTSPRNILDNKQNTLQLENADVDLLYHFPAYIRAHFRGQVGYSTWGKLFGASIDVCKQEFVKSYSDENGIEAGKVEFILGNIYSPYDTISLFEFLHFIKENKDYFDAKGHIVKEKLEDIEGHITKLSQSQLEDLPNEVSENTFEYKNGAKYEGKLVDGKRQGEGKLTFQQYSYEGTFEKGQPNGKGTEVKFGVKYEGEFSNGLFQGEGLLTFPDGTQYKGGFVSNKYEGKGTLTAWNGIQYSGQWKSGSLAEGTITYPTGQVYEGLIANNRFRHGQGVLKSNGQVVFEGLFLNDEFSNGKLFQGKHLLYEGELNQNEIVSGKFNYSDASYNGNLNTGLYSREQQGTLSYYNDGSSISGTWVSDAPTVATKLFDSKSPEQRYEGEWKNFSRTGRGKFNYQSGAVYEGDIVNSLRIGKGSYTFKNQNKYDGDWVDNNLSGNGVFTFSNGDVYTGQFQNGQFHGKGTYKYSNGTQYEGEWANDKWNGYGKYTDPSGKVIKEGNFVNDDIQKTA